MRTKTIIIGPLNTLADHRIAIQALVDRLREMQSLFASLGDGNQPAGVVILDSDGKIPSSLLP